MVRENLFRPISVVMFIIIAVAVVGNWNFSG